LKDRNTLIFYLPEKCTQDFTPLRQEKDTVWIQGKFSSRNVNRMQYSKNRLSFTLPKKFFSTGIFVRQWKTGDRICLFGSNYNVKLSHLFTNQKLSRLKKMIQPVVVNSADTVLWLPGIAHGNTTDQYSSSTHQLMEITWYPN